MHTLKLIAMIIFVLLVLIYFSFGKLAWFLSVMHGDFPGAKEIKTKSVKPNQAIDWLFIHGASLDARVWKSILNRRETTPMVALSVGDHELGIRYSKPYKAYLDIENYLSLHQINKGII